MALILSTPMLCDISKDLTQGRPLWALLRANEYLSPKNPLRSALVSKAKAFFRSETRYIEQPALVHAVVKGATLGQFTHKEKRAIQELEQGSVPTTRRQYYFNPGRRSDRTSRTLRIQEKTGS